MHNYKAISLSLLSKYFIFNMQEHDTNFYKTFKTIVIHVICSSNENVKIAN